MCVSFHLKQEWGGQPFFPGTGALEETGEYQVSVYSLGGVSNWEGSCDSFGGEWGVSGENLIYPLGGKGVAGSAR